MLRVMGTNRKGETIVIRDGRQMYMLPKGQTLEQFVVQEERAAARAAIKAEDAAIEAVVLAAGPGVVAVQDTRSGKVTGVFLHPAALSTPPHAPVGTRATPSEGRVPPQPSSADQLRGLKAELNELLKTLADPGTDPATGAHAQARADAVRQAILDLGRRHPVPAA
jgi:hypothetical protein